MPLQGSGPISLDDIHVEAGGISGTQATINDADIRNLIQKPVNTTMSFSEWYGVSSMVISVEDSTGGDIELKEGTTRNFDVVIGSPIATGGTVQWQVSAASSNAADINAFNIITTKSGSFTYSAADASNNPLYLDEAFSVTIGEDDEFNTYGNIIVTVTETTTGATGTDNIGVDNANPQYSVVAPNSINEGSSGTVSINVTNYNGSTLYWTVTPEDQFSTSSGSISLTNGVFDGSVTLSVLEDSITGDGETATFRLRAGSVSGNVLDSDTFTINDTTVSPYSITVSDASISEGATTTFTIVRGQDALNESLSYEITGDQAAINRISTPLTGTISVGDTNLTVSTTQDNEYQGATTFNLEIVGDTSGSAAVSPDVTLSDAVATLGFDTSVQGFPTEVNEGGTITVPAGSLIGFNIPPVNTIEGQFAPLDSWVGNTSNFNINWVWNATKDRYENQSSASYTTASDVTLDDSSVLIRYTENGQVIPGLFESVTVNNTDAAPLPTVTIDAQRSTGNVNESGSFTFSATASTAISGTVDFALSGSADHTDDYTVSGASTTTTGSFTFNNSTSSDTLTVSMIQDNTTEGGETIGITISNPSVSGYNASIGTATTSVNVQDTSLDPEPTATYTVQSGVQVDEGFAATITVDTTNVPIGTTLYWSIDAPGVVDDFSNSSGSNNVQSNGSIEFIVGPLADAETEGDETATVTIRTGSQSGTIVATGSFTVNDTSTTPPPITVTISDMTVYDLNITQGSDAYAAVRFLSSGGTEYIGSDVSTPVDNSWSSTISSGVGSNYEIRADLVQGSISPEFGNTAVWETLQFTKTWSISAQGENAGIRESILDISIREEGTTTVLDTGRITLRAEDLGNPSDGGDFN